MQIQIYEIAAKLILPELIKTLIHLYGVFPRSAPANEFHLVWD